VELKISCRNLSFTFELELVQQPNYKSLVVVYLVQKFEYLNFPLQLFLVHHSISNNLNSNLSLLLQIKGF